ncbi:hypothetical protein [Sphingomonas morindae]|uniref:Uncharacterized protein n=1 Tax=Sphingomonas morindae TaxID=1541170 RepID=A0ABY4XAE6_9SPHN|nr:hypothetical protein [Sphingomonas morindae]USI73936.1 hypothetical protein LHA26_05575 [Sphingomonas morindae]
MTEQICAPMTNREFVARVRAKLDAAGRRDVPISRLWIDEDTIGYPFLLKVPVGPELLVPLQPMDGFYDETARTSDWHIDYFAAALINLRSAERMLIRYARDIRRQALRQIEDARSKGLDVSLEGIGFRPTYAWHLSGDNWKDAAHHVLAEVKLRNTSFSLRPENTQIWVEEPADVGRHLESVLKEQREHQALAGEMEAMGADLIVDGITMDLLAASGFDAVDVLRKVWKEQCVNMTIRHGGLDRHFSVISFRGRTSASVDLENASWNGEHLWFHGEAERPWQRDLVGRTLAGLVDHPAFAARTVIGVGDGSPQGRPGQISLDISDRFLFDADTGSIWPQERHAA